MRMGLNAWFMKIMKATMKCSVRDLELRSFCLDVDFEAVLFLVSKFTTSFLETLLLFCILTPGQGHEAGKSHQMGGSCQHIDAELFLRLTAFCHVLPKGPSACYSVVMDI